MEAVDSSQYSLEQWQGRIREVRTECMPRPSQVLEDWAAQAIALGRIFETPDSFIQAARAELWAEYKQIEIRFNRAALQILLKESDLATSWLEATTAQVLTQWQDTLAETVRAALTERSAVLLGDLFPYIYELDLSTTQSRRSRAGKEFEAIIGHLLASRNVPYSDQSSISASRSRATAAPGKIVDFLVPGLDAYNSSRPNCAVLSCKTTLRERWQQVVEEKTRTNTDHLYLLTLDRKIARDKLALCADSNITLVVSEDVKAGIDSNAVIGFNRLFDHELPHKLAYWK